MDDKTIEGIQGIAALVGITLGAIPLIRVLLGGEVGRLLAWAPGTDTSPGRWLVPLVVVVAALAAIGLLERSRRR